jgi:alpha-mannosidase
VERSVRSTFPLLAVLTLAAAAPARAQDRVIRDWLIRGPIPAEHGEAGVLKDYLGSEATVLPAPGDSVAGGPFRPVRADSLGRVDLNALVGPADWSVAYAHTYVFAPTERSVLLVMDSDDDIVGRVNGQRVWVHIVPRGIGPGRDTARVRLAAGWNTVLLKVVNRTGGFDLLSKLADAPGGGSVADLRLATDRPAGMTAQHYPAASVELGPLTVSGAARWQGADLLLQATVAVTAWGADTIRDARMTVSAARAALIDRTVAALAPGAPVAIDLPARFADLRDAALGKRPLTAAVRSTAGRRQATLFVDPEPLLRLQGAPLDVFGAVADTTPPAPPLAATLVVPAAYGGLHLDLLSRGMGPGARYLVNGTARTWERGNVVLCGPCRAGDTLALAITPDPARPLWLGPQARVEEPGFAEYADGYRYARALEGTAPAIAPPDPAEWLAALGTPADGALRERYRAAYAPLAQRIRQDTLELIGNAHIDAAWLWRWHETIDVIRNTWRTSLKLAAIFPGYVFAGSSAAFYDAMDRLEPGLADSLVAATRAGSWAPVGGSWIEPDMNNPSGESLIRQVLYGQRYFQRRFGTRSKVAWTPDTFGYPWTVPQILRGAGFDSFVTQKMRWNDSTEFPYNAFIWEGLDGSRIFTYNPYGYTHDLMPADLIRERVEDRARTGNHHQIVLYGVGDHGGGPTIEMLERAEQLRRVPTFPAMRYAGPEEALAAEAGDKPPAGFPVWDDEMYLEYHRGTYTSHAAMKRRNRRSEVLLQTAEALATVDTAAYPHARIESAWRRVLFNQFHDILPGSGIDSIYRDANANYDSAWATLDSVTGAAFQSLRARMDTRGRGTAVVVFNPLSWSRGGRVAVPGRADDTAWVVVDSVPPLGARVVHLPGDARPASYARLPAPVAGPTWIENAFLRVEIDTLTGTVTRLYDKVNARDVLAAGGRGNVLQVLDDRPAQWDAWNLMPNPETWEVTALRRHGASADADAARFTIERTWGGSTFRQALVLRRDAPYLDVENDVDWHERQKLLKIGFALGVAPDSATYEIPYGTIGRSGRPRTKAERAKFEVPGQRWADVADGGYGVAILNDSKDGWDYKAGPTGSVLRLSLLKAPIYPDSTADRGRHHFRLAVYPHAGDWRAAAVDRRAVEYNVPLLAAAEPPHDGRLGRAVSFASVAPANVQLTWLKRAEDGDRWVLRLVEWHGRATAATVTLGCRGAGAWRANLLEDAGAPVPVEAGQIRIPLRPFEITTLLVECTP